MQSSADHEIKPRMNQYLPLSLGFIFLRSSFIDSLLFFKTT